MEYLAASALRSRRNTRVPARSLACPVPTGAFSRTLVEDVPGVRLLPARPRFPAVGPGRGCAEPHRGGAGTGRTRRGAAAARGAPASGSCAPRRPHGREEARGGAAEAPPLAPLGESLARGSQGGWAGVNFGVVVTREHAERRRQSVCVCLGRPLRSGGEVCVWGRGRVGLVSGPHPSVLGGLVRPWGRSEARRREARSAPSCEVQPSAGTGSRPAAAAATAMEPHRWLPLEANPDVSARRGVGAAGELLAGGRRLEERRRERARGRSGLGGLEGWPGAAGNGGGLSSRVLPRS